jgi:dimethylargininase
VRPVAVVRDVGPSFARCLTAEVPVPPLDPVLAADQHAGYVAVLARSGFAVMQLPADDAYPDACFVEDTAVVIERSVLLARPGHPSRRGEVDAVAAALTGLDEMQRVGGDATLDGGDVLQVGDTVFVGVGRRTNSAGADSLEQFCRPLGRSVVRVPVGKSLHLKSSVTALDPETVLAHVSAGDSSAFSGLKVIEVSGENPEAANVVRLADGSILVAAQHRSTADLVEALGYRVESCDVSEFARADGGLTCLSIRLRDVLAP